jgi:uncharacterized protein (TIGR02444 family)
MPPENPFWEFSLAAYSRPGVAEACLRLQDDAGADVNLLLYCCWMAAVCDDAMSRARAGETVAGTQEWRDGVVVPLRAVRRRLKDRPAELPPESVEGLRAEVKRIELESERLEQDLLYRMGGAASRKAEGGPAARARAEQNIKAYLSVIGAAESPQAVQDCRTIADACLPG